MQIIDFIIVGVILLIICGIAYSYRKMIDVGEPVLETNENIFETVGPSHVIVMEEDTNTPVLSGTFASFGDLEETPEEVVEEVETQGPDPDYTGPDPDYTGHDTPEEVWNNNQEVLDAPELEVVEDDEDDEEFVESEEETSEETVIVADEIVVNEVKPVQE